MFASLLIRTSRVGQYVVRICDSLKQIEISACVKLHNGVAKPGNFP